MIIINNYSTGVFSWIFIILTEEDVGRVKAKIRRYSARLSRIIVLLFKTLMTQHNFLRLLGKKAGKTTIFLCDTQNYVYAG